MSDVQPIPGSAPDAAVDARLPAPAPKARLRLGEDDVLYDELDAPARDFVKAFTNESGSDGEGLPVELLDQAAVQCRMAKARAIHWAIVREAVRETNGYRLIIPVHAGSVQRLISERSPLRAGQLHAIVAGTVAGLVEIGRVLKRTHGNLKPTNVLLRSRRLATPDVVALTDPAPTVRADERGKAADLRRLGEMIHLLVLHRLPRGHDDWPVPPSHEWDQFGRHGGAWRELCTLLTDPSGPQITLPDVGRYVARLQPARSSALVRRGALVAAAVVAIGGGAMWIRGSHHNKVAVAPLPPRPPAILVAPTTRPATDTLAIAAKPTVPPAANAAVAAAHVTAPLVPKPVIDAAMARQLTLDGLRTWAEQVDAARSAIADTAAALRGDWDARRRQRAMAKFVDECGRPAVAALPQVAKAIDEQNHRFGDEVARDPNRFNAELVAQRDQVVRRLAQVDRTMNGLATSAPPAKVVTPIGRRLEAALAKDRQHAQAEAVAQGIQLALSPDTAGHSFADGLKSLTANVAAARDAGAQLAAEVDRVAQRLAEGFTPDAAPDGVKIRDVAARWPTTPAYGSADVKAAIAPLLAAMSASDPTTLQQIASSKDELLGLRLAAWQAMPTPSAAKRTDLEDAATMRDALLAAAAGALKSSAHFDPVAAGIAQEYGRRWERAVAQFAHGEDVAFAMTEAMRPSGLDVSKLRGAARWNVEWFALREMLASHPKGADALPRARAMVAGLLTAAADLPPAVAKQAQTAAVIGKLRGWDGQPAPEDFAQLGPASPAARVLEGPTLHWAAQPDATGTTITYRPSSTVEPSLFQDDALVFRRVSSPAAGDVFICTTEMSMGVFSDVLTAANRWREVKENRLLGIAPDVVTPPDLRAGPRVWQWSPRRDGGIVRSLVWLSSDWVPGGADDYPESLGGEFNRATLRPPHGQEAENPNPSRRHPMQQVSADAAQYFATLIGCRLPTPQEWRLAYASTSQGATGANLRDHAWRLEQEHIARNWPHGGTTYRADAGMFVPAGEAPSDEVWRTAGGQEYDDGCLWFREVLAAGADAREFQNLAGNVGEFARDGAGKVYVIGGSAMSPPSRPLDKEFEVPARERRSGFADVGFRLAFSPPPSPLERLAAIMPGQDGGYVSESGK